MKRYFALTIGPIYYTFLQARKTRAVWAASYFFSWFIKRVLQQCSAQGIPVAVPSLAHLHNPSSGLGSGKYADRIYFEGIDDAQNDAIIEIVRLVTKEVADDISRKLTIGREEAAGFLKEYLNIHFVADDISEKYLERLNCLLDHCELKQRYVFNYDRNYLLEYLSKEVSLGGRIAEDAFGIRARNRYHRFRSIPEIATTDIRRVVPEGLYDSVVDESFDKDELEFYDELKRKTGSLMKPYHKYYAVLYADGDNIGGMLQKIGDKTDDLQKFSCKLLDFADRAEKSVAEYGGNTIYLGGEDILAFLPIACRGLGKLADVTQTLFTVVKQLGDDFHNTLGAYAVEIGCAEPTLSFGIAASYAKYPLKETMDAAHDLLKEVKNIPGKNAIGLRFQRHSGQFEKSSIQQSKAASLNAIYSFAAKYCGRAHQNNPDSELETELLSGVIHRFRNDLFFRVFEIAAGQKRLRPFFDNFFNEDIHKKDTLKKEFLSDLAALAEKVFEEYDGQGRRDVFFSVLRYVHFINSTKEE